MSEQRLTTEDFVRGPGSDESPRRDEDVHDRYAQEVPEQTTPEQTAPEQTAADQTYDRTSSDDARYDSAGGQATEERFEDRSGADEGDDRRYDADGATEGGEVARGGVEQPHDRSDEVGRHEEEPVGGQAAPTTTGGVTGGDTPLFTEDDANRYREEWRALQADFVDEPSAAVRHADELVAQVMQNLATTFAEHKRSLEGQWRQGDTVDTEELRLALQRYRSFFDRLLSV